MYAFEYMCVCIFLLSQTHEHTNTHAHANTHAKGSSDFVQGQKQRPQHFSMRVRSCSAFFVLALMPSRFSSTRCNLSRSTFSNVGETKEKSGARTCTQARHETKRTRGRQRTALLVKHLVGSSCHVNVMVNKVAHPARRLHVLIQDFIGFPVHFLHGLHSLAKQNKRKWLQKGQMRLTFKNQAWRA